MNRRVLLVLMLVCALVVLAPRAWAQWPPETHPTDQSRDIVMTWDRSAVPGDVELWARRTVLGFSHDRLLRYGQIHALCESNSDPALGRCRTDPLIGEAEGTSEVVVRAVEQRTGLWAEIRSVGHLERVNSDRSCLGDFWQPILRPLFAARLDLCGTGESLGTGVRLTMPA